MEENPKSVRIKGFPDYKIDKDIQTLLLPLNMMQIVTLHPKYQIKKNLIKPNSVIMRLITCCSTALFVFEHWYNYCIVLSDQNMRRYQTIKFLYFASTFDVLFNNMAFIITNVTYCIKSKKNVEFLLTFQDIHRFLDNKRRNKIMLINSWICVSLIFGFYTFSTVYLNFHYFQPPWYTLLHIFVLVILDTDSIYAIRLIRLLVSKLELWNRKLMDRGDNDVDCYKIFKAYIQIHECYNSYKDIFQAATFIKTTESLFHELVNNQILIDFFKYVYSVKEPHFMQALLFAWILKNLSIITTLSLFLEQYYDMTAKVKDSCFTILSTDCTDEERKMCKNILRLHRASFHKMSVYRLFYVDICHPMRLMVLLTNYTIVLLQLAFL